MYCFILVLKFNKHLLQLNQCCLLCLGKLKGASYFRRLKIPFKIEERWPRDLNIKGDASEKDILDVTLAWFMHCNFNAVEIGLMSHYLG